MAADPERGATRGPVRPPVALAFATIGFGALAIFGLGMATLFTGEAVIAAPGLGFVPGAAGFVCAMLAFAGVLWASIGRADVAATQITAGDPGRPRAGGSRHPSYWGSAWAAVVCFVAYVGGVWLAALFTGTDLAVATGVAARLATSWFGLVIAVVAFVCAWSGIALVRTRARRPRWPWEDEFDE